MAGARARPRARRARGGPDRRSRARLRRPASRSSPIARACVAFPVAANSVGTAPDVRRLVELAHAAGALAWADAVHYAPHGPIDVAAWDVDVLICSPYKFFGPHMGLAFGKRELLESWRPYKVRPAANEPVGHRFELGTSQHELLAGFVAAVDYIDSLGWDAMLSHERALGERFLAGLPGRDRALRDPRHGRTRADLLLQRARTQRRGGRDVPRRARGRGLAWRLLRGRDDEAPRARRRRRTRQASSTTTPRTRSTACSTGSPSWREAPPPRRAAVPRPSRDGRRARRAATRSRSSTAEGRTPSCTPRSSASSATAPGPRRAARSLWDAVVDTCGYLPASCARRPRRSPTAASTASCRASRCMRTSRGRSTRTARSPSSATFPTTR